MSHAPSSKGLKTTPLNPSRLSGVGWWSLVGGPLLMLYEPSGKALKTPACVLPVFWGLVGVPFLEHDDYHSESFFPFANVDSGVYRIYGGGIVTANTHH